MAHLTPEIVAPVDLCLADGRLNPAARGWSRHPLHRCNLRGPWGRTKRWDYWCVTTETHLLALTYANLDYLGLASAMFVDLESGEVVERGTGLPLAFGFREPEEVGGAAIEVDRFGLQVAFRPRQGGTELEVAGRGIRGSIFVEQPPGHETLNVVIPWSDEQFQFTSKQNTLPARGEVTVGGRRYLFGPENQAFACLDFGRGIWPHRTHWNWASASGYVGERLVGLQLGGKWTDGTGMTENAICVDGRLETIAEPLSFEYDTRDYRQPWRITSRDRRRVDLLFEPCFEKRLRVELGLAGAEAHICFGHFAGTLGLDELGELRIARLFGWAEEFRGRW